MNENRCSRHIAIPLGRLGDYTPKHPVEEEHLKHPREIERIRRQIVTSALEGLAVHLGGIKQGRKSLIFTGVSTDVCLAFPAMAALADGFQSYAVIDASGGFTQTQVDMGILRMVQAGVIPVCYSNVAVEILADNAAPEAEAVYGALGMPFSSLVFGLRQYFSRA